MRLLICMNQAHVKVRAVVVWAKLFTTWGWIDIVHRGETGTASKHKYKQQLAPWILQLVQVLCHLYARRLLKTLTQKIVGAMNPWQTKPATPEPNHIRWLPGICLCKVASQASGHRKECAASHDRVPKRFQKEQFSINRFRSIAAKKFLTKDQTWDAWDASCREAHCRLTFQQTSTNQRSCKTAPELIYRDSHKSFQSHLRGR